MKVCLASWAPYFGGAEVAAERLAIGLREAGCDVVVVLGTKGETLERLRRGGVRCAHVPLAFTDKRRFWKYLRARHAFSRFLTKEWPDIVHANDLPTNQMVGEVAARMSIPCICHHRFPFDASGVHWLNKFGTELHLFISQSIMDEMTEASQELRTSRRALVYDGIPLPPVPSRESRLEARGALQIPLDKTVVTFAGQIIERKGVADLLRAWSLLGDEVRASSLLLIIGDDLAGNGAYRRCMEELAMQLGITPRFTGFQYNVDQWWQASDIAVVPSHVEPLGLVTLEAMAAVLPVIGGAVGGIRETIVHGETGLLVPPHNPRELAAALETLIGDASLRQRLGQAGRKRCEEKFSLKAHVEAVLEQYRCVLAGRTR